MGAEAPGRDTDNCVLTSPGAPADALIGIEPSASAMARASHRNPWFGLRVGRDDDVRLGTLRINNMLASL
jgi:hypothetical protein